MLLKSVSPLCAAGAAVGIAARIGELAEQFLTDSGSAQEKERKLPARTAD